MDRLDYSSSYVKVVPQEVTKNKDAIRTKDFSLYNLVQLSTNNASHD